MHHSALTVCKHRVSGSISPPSRGAFHLSLTVLVHYRSPGYLALGRGRPSFPPGSSCPAVLRIPITVHTVSITGLSPSPAGLSRRVHLHCGFVTVRSQCRLLWVLQHLLYNGGTLSRTKGLGFSRFVRHYYGNCLFSSGYLDVSVPPLASLTKSVRVPTHHGGGLPHSEISGSACKRLPGAYRSVTTSFIGPGCQGIHHMLLFACKALPFLSLTPSAYWSPARTWRPGRRTKKVCF